MVEFLNFNRYNNIYKISDEHFDDYVMRRVAEVREGAIPAREIELVNGNVYRCQCFALDDGGRMLTYVDITELKKQQKDLRQSEENFRTLSEIGNDWFWQTDSEHKFITYKGYRAIGGLPEDGVLGAPRWENASRRDLMDTEKWERHRAQLNAHEKFRNFEFQLKTDRPAWISVSGDPIFDENGDFQGHRGIATVITRRMQAEEELRSSEARFRDFAENAADWIVSKKPRALMQDFHTDIPPLAECDCCGNLGPIRRVDKLGHSQPNHVKFLGADMLLIEWCTNLGAITKERAQVIALPLKIKGTEGTPARVVVVEED